MAKGSKPTDATDVEPADPPVTQSATAVEGLTTAASIGAVDQPAVEGTPQEVTDNKPAEDDPHEPKKRRYRVALHARTPLAFPMIEVDAISESDAKAQYSEQNGIGASIHPWTVDLLD